MTTATARSARFPLWVSALLPLVLVGILTAVLLGLDPIGDLRPTPPVESVAFERVTLERDSIELKIRNDGPDPVTIAQVLVNEAYWDYEIDDRELGRLEQTSLRLAYPWEEGLPVVIGLVTETGVVIDHEIEAAALTPEADASTVAVYALLGVYIGVIPVAVGLLWFPALARAARKWVLFFLAFTVGLLAFLLVDTVAEGLELATEAAAFDGLGLFAIGSIGAVLGLVALESFMERRRAASTGLRVAYLIAMGIGLHNLGEGLAVGSAIAAGELALGTFLVLGFALHNTTEGLAIVAPLGGEQERPSLWHFAGLGAVAGAPTILGAWLGGFAFSPSWGAVFFGVAAGAIAQVIWVIGRNMRTDKEPLSGLVAAGFMLGLVIMYITGLFVAA
jgi:zinc transporter, ZIP family